MKSEKEIQDCIKDCETAIQRNLQQLRNPCFTWEQQQPILNVIQMDEKTKQVLQWVLQEEY